MNHQHKSLIELIFTKCALVYGRDFLARWEGQNIGEVMEDWVRELGRALDNPQTIKYALENLPHAKPPNVLQFRDLCIARPEPLPPMLPAPKADPRRVRKVLQSLKLGAVHPKQWAHDLQHREANGDILSLAQRHMWREALKDEIREASDD